jgi:hypothetical protein
MLSALSECAVKQTATTTLHLPLYGEVTLMELASILLMAIIAVVLLLQVIALVQIAGMRKALQEIKEIKAPAAAPAAPAPERFERKGGDFRRHEKGPIRTSGQDLHHQTALLQPRLRLRQRHPLLRRTPLKRHCAISTSGLKMPSVTRILPVKKYRKILAGTEISTIGVTIGATVTAEETVTVKGASATVAVTETEAAETEIATETAVPDVTTGSRRETVLQRSSPLRRQRPQSPATICRPLKSGLLTQHLPPQPPSRRWHLLNQTPRRCRLHRNRLFFRRPLPPRRRQSTKRPLITAGTMRAWNTEEKF